jgi:hypothetical protein
MPVEVEAPAEALLKGVKARGEITDDERPLVVQLVAKAGANKDVRKAVTAIVNVLTGPRPVQRLLGARTTEVLVRGPDDLTNTELYNLLFGDGALADFNDAVKAHPHRLNRVQIERVLTDSAECTKPLDGGTIRLMTTQLGRPGVSRSAGNAKNMNGAYYVALYLSLVEEEE